jgi:putative ABC transport system permease protein
MVLRDLLISAVRTLWGHKLRSLLTMFGITWGIVSITLMIAAGEGLQVGFREQEGAFGKDLLVIHAGRTSLQAGGRRAGRRLRWEDTDYRFVGDQSPDCKYVMPELGNRAGIRSRFNSALSLVTGSFPEFAEIRSIEVAQGRFYNWGDETGGRRVAFLGSDLKKQLFADRPAIGETIYIADHPYMVIGVMQEKQIQRSDYDGRDAQKVFAPFSAVLHDLPARPPDKPTSIDRLLATPTSVGHHEACLWELRRALARRYDFDPHDEDAANIIDTIKDAQAFEVLTGSMQIFLGAVGLATLFVGGIGVMNVMLVAVRERTREIGVRKAVGATRAAILWQFFVEALMMVLASGGLGLAVAFGVCAVVNQFPMPDYFAGLIATWESALVAFGLLGLTGVLSALYPARRAASVDPIEALRFEPGG